MNARELHQAVVADLEKLFSGNYFKTPKHTMEPINVYRQDLPQFDAQGSDDFFPYIIVRLEGGGVKDPTAPHKVDVLLIIGLFDDATEEYRPGAENNYDEDGKPTFISESGWDTRNFGAMAVMEVMERIQAHYEMEPSLENGKFYFDGPFHWVMQDEDSWPYYFGICEMSFTLAAPRKKESQFV